MDVDADIAVDVAEGGVNSSSFPFQLIMNRLGNQYLGNYVSFCSLFVYSLETKNINIVHFETNPEGRM